MEAEDNADPLPNQDGEEGPPSVRRRVEEAEDVAAPAFCGDCRRGFEDTWIHSQGRVLCPRCFYIRWVRRFPAFIPARLPDGRAPVLED